MIKSTAFFFISFFFLCGYSQSELNQKDKKQYSPKSELNQKDKKQYSPKSELNQKDKKQIFF